MTTMMLKYYYYYYTIKIYKLLTFLFNIVKECLHLRQTEAEVSGIHVGNLKKLKVTS